MCWLEELEEEAVKFIWSLHEMECTDEMISEAVKKPVDYVQDVLKKMHLNKKRNKKLGIEYKKCRKVIELMMERHFFGLIAKTNVAYLPLKRRPLQIHEKSVPKICRNA